MFYWVQVIWSLQKCEFLNMFIIITNLQLRVSSKLLLFYYEGTDDVDQNLVGSKLQNQWFILIPDKKNNNTNYGKGNFENVSGGPPLNVLTHHPCLSNMHMWGSQISFLGGQFGQYLFVVRTRKWL